MSDRRPLAPVTGTASGIGRACALLLAKRGYDVNNNSRSADRAEQTLAELHDLGGEHTAVAPDVADDKAASELLSVALRGGDT